VGTSVDRSDSGDETAWLVLLVTGKSEDDAGPVGGAMSPRVGMGEEDHGTPEGARRSVAVGGVNVLEERGADAKVSGGERLTILVGSEASLCITWVAAESREVAGMWRLSMAV